MAGPSIVVRVLGDLKALGTSMDGTAAKAQTTAQRAHSAFSSMLGQLNASGVLGPFGGALNAIDHTFGVLADHAKGIGTTMMGIGGGMTALGATLSAFGSKEQASHQQLQAAIKTTGKDYDDYADRIEKAVKQQENYGHSSAQTQDALAKLTEATHDPAKAIELLGTVSNVAAAKHEDLSSAATAVGKVYNGNTKLLKEFGVTIDKTTKQTSDGKSATQALADVTAGQASAATNTYMGRLDALKTKLEDHVSMIGQKYGPALQGAGVGIMALGSMWEVVGPMIAAGELSALGPILLIVAAIAVLAAAAYLIYRNWDTIWKGMHAAIEVVWDWIKNNWPLLVGILFGPVGIAVGLIVTHLDQVKAGAKAVVDFIVNVFTGLGRDMEHIASDIWRPLETGFKDVVNAIAHAWNSTIGKLHVSIPSWVPGIGGHGFDAPTIPALAAGGLITSSGLIYAHAGEAISPIPAGLGPGINIENVHLSDELDVDSFMRRLNWNLQTERL